MEYLTDNNAILKCVTSSRLAALMTNIFQVPHMEGRVGMVTIVDINDDLNLEEFHEHVDKRLPAHARPVFLRIAKKIEITGTYKLKKVDFQKEGFNPSVVKDKLYFRLKDGYVPITLKLYEEILSGKFRY